MKYYLLIVSLAILLTGVESRCVEGCAFCNTYADCSSCQTGWTYDSQNQKCQPCPEHCQRCTKNTNTSAFTCQDCENIFYKDSSGNCLRCDQNCVSCQGSYDNCTACSAGYVTTPRTNSAKMSCQRNDSCAAQNCFRCSSNSDYQCQICQPGYSNFVGICLDCTFPCKQCNYPFKDIFWNSVVPFIESLKIYEINQTNWNNSYWNNSYWNSSNSSYWNNSYWNNSYWNNSYWNNSYWNNSYWNNSYWNNSYWNSSNSSYWNNSYWNNSYWNNSYGNYSNSSNGSYPFASAPYWRIFSSQNSNIDDIDIFNVNYSSLTDSDIKFVAFGKWVYDINYDDIQAKVNAGTLTMNKAVKSIQQIINQLRRLSFQTEQDILQLVSNNLQSLLQITKNTNSLKLALHSQFQGENSCGLCLNGYSLSNNSLSSNGTNLTNITNTICSLCGGNCKECDGDTCFVCQTGYSLTFNNQCESCTYPCSECFDYSSSSCLACETPFNLNFDNRCVQCSTPCKTCSVNDTNYCETCFSPYSLYAENGTCVFCTDANCQVCAGNDTSLCYQCSDGFLLQNNQCVTCTANCQRCIENSICANCMDGYGHSGAQCVACESGCKSCTHAGTICQKCFDGMYVDSNGDCNLCPSPCLTCETASTCTTYEEGKVSYGSLVVDCRPGCRTCDAASPDLCTSCEEHYFLSGSNCLKCSSSCKQCTSASACTDCEYGYALVSGQCQACSDTCLQCKPMNPNICQVCDYGYALINGQCLYQCERGCIECDTSDPTICYECDEGYSLRKNGKCIKCLSGCSGSCDPENITECLSCKDGFQLLSNTCVRCPTGCETCFAGQCTQCKYGYELKEVNNRFTCKEECFLGCDECSNATTCTQCSSGLELSGNNCVPNTTYGQSHGFCPLGTIKVNNNQCVACSELNCASCNQSQCHECFDGYYANNGQCTKCTSPCEKCVDAKTCQRCADGYFLRVISKGTQTTSKTYGKKCKPCHAKCLTCEDKRRTCLSCHDTHRLNGTKCVSRYVVRCVFVFDFSYSIFLQEGRLLEIINYFVTLLAKDPDQITVNSIKQGSTAVTLGVSAENQQQADQNQQAISNNQGSIPIPVLSSNVGVYYDDQLVQNPTEETTAESSSNIGIIIGAAVGAVVVIGIIVFACYRYRQKQNSTLQLGDSNNQMNEDHSQHPAIIGVVGQNHVIAEHDETENINNLKVIYS